MAQGCSCSVVTTLQLTTITYITPHSTLNDTASSQKSTGGPGHRCSFNFSCPFLGRFAHFLAICWSACATFNLNDFTFDFQIFKAGCSSIAHSSSSWLVAWWTDAVVLSIVYWFLSGIQNSSCPCMHQLSRILGNMLGAKFISRQLQMIFKLKHLVILL